MATVEDLFPQEDYQLDKIAQGAEAIVFTAAKTPHSDGEKSPLILKYRPSKRYRHPILDKAITKQRTKAEAKVLTKLYSMGLPVPQVVHMDVVKGAIFMTKLGEQSLKAYLWEREHQAGYDTAEVKHVIVETGRVIGRMHLSGVVHGDLTSSNIVVMKTSGVGLIDFGLSNQKATHEDKSVDLYVLERAFLSTHSSHAEIYTEWLLEGYSEQHGRENAKEMGAVLARLKDVRMRGRKRSMLG